MSEVRDCECRTVTLEQMKKDLLGGGWEPSHGGAIWTALWGTILRGPFRAWHYWAGIPMCEDGKVKT